MVIFNLISPDFATSSVALHKHRASVVVKRLSNFASLALSTLAPMFSNFKTTLRFCLIFGKTIFFRKPHSAFLGERSEAYSHKDTSSCFRFSSHPWHPSAFQLFKSFFLRSWWSDSSNFCLNTTTGSWSFLFQPFGRRKVFFRWVISDESFILGFF